jgi:precorrin-2 dehydrogenase / sirohydrochlorin ferrochelatase
MNDFYPIHLNLKGKKVIVIGGGLVAERKVNGLMGTGALIEIISPHLTENLKKMAAEKQLTWTAKLFTSEDISHAFLVIAATNDRDTNHQVKRSAAIHQLVNIADDPANSDFIIPAVVKRGKLGISVSTSGASPILSAKIRKQLEDLYDESYEDYLEFLYSCRKFILANVQEPVKKKQLLSAIVNTEYLESHTRKEDFLLLYNDIMST